jgi:hypothetical protein
MLLNHDMEEARFHGRFSTPKGDIRVRTRPLTRLAEKPGSTIGGAIKMELAENFVISGCSSRPLTRPVFVGRDYVLTLPARKYTARVWRHPEKCLGALQVSC